jgi:hypothetical protein
MRTALLTAIAATALGLAVAAPAQAAEVTRDDYLASVTKAAATLEKQMKGKTVRHTSNIDFMLKATTTLVVNPDDSLIFDVDSLGAKARVICIAEDECWIRRDNKPVFNPLPKGAVTLTRSGGPGDQVDTDGLPADATYGIKGKTFTIAASEDGQQATARQTFTNRTYRYSIEVSSDGLEGSMSGMTKVLPKKARVKAPPAKKIGPIDTDFTVDLNATTGAYSSKDGTN